MANFTPQQIEQFLQEFFDVVGARQYIGARYVPIFGRAGEDTVEWDDRAPYEPLTVVMHLGVSYVSRRYVPMGIPITDTDYWVETYRFNAQVEQYRQEVLGFNQRINDNAQAIVDEAQARDSADREIRNDVADDFVPFPNAESLPKYGTDGQVLSTDGQGGTEWVDPVVPSDAQAEAVITEWLNNHPEATTTVQDNSVTDAKLVQSGGILSTVDTLQAQFDQNVSYRIPFEARDGINATQEGCYRHIKYARIDPSHVGWRVGTIYTNSNDDPQGNNYRVIYFLNSSNHPYGPLPYDANTGLNKLNNDAIYYDWENHVPTGFTLGDYDSCYIDLVEIPINLYDINETANQNAEDVAELLPRQAMDDETLDDLRIYDNTPIGSIATFDNKYINLVKTYGTYTGNTYVSFYPVSKGKVYRVYGIATRFTYPTYGFSLASDITTPLLWTSEPIESNEHRDIFNFSENYVAPEDGYIVITHFYSDTTHFNVSEAVPETSVGFGTFETQFKNAFNFRTGDQITPTYSADHYYITAPYVGLENGSIEYWDSEVAANYTVDWYAINKGETVVIYGDSKLNANLPLATFGKSKLYYDYNLFDYSDANVKKERTLLFTAPYDGFIAIAGVLSYSTNGHMVAYQTVYRAITDPVSKQTVKIQAFGDSITDNANNTWAGHTTWLNYIEGIVSPHYDATIINSAYGGASLSNHNAYSVVNYVCGNTDLSVTSQLDETADIIMLWAGTNDWAGGATPIGAFDGADTTLVGALQKIIKYVSEHTHAALIVATPMQRYNDSDESVQTRNEYDEVIRNGYTLKEMCDAMEEICEFYGIDCIRMDRMAGFNRENIRTYCGDGLHPSTEVANRRIASIFATEFQRMVAAW